jgi:hypothetical protein
MMLISCLASMPTIDSNSAVHQFRFPSTMKGRDTFIGFCHRAIAAIE